MLLCACAYGYVSTFHRSEIPQEVFHHFCEIPRIEFCTVDPTHRDDVEVLIEDFGYGDIEGYSIVDRVYLKDHQSLISRVAWADRLNNHQGDNCFRPRHAIRDPEDRRNYLLISFECMMLEFSCNGEKEKVMISQSQAHYFESLADEHSMTLASDLQ